ncbi:HD domain-containing protein [Streptomyces scabiei]|uniref:HD domain-containing protein n=1 Tax=Streptomyces scabiei TaxID=1930 RepID=UPI0007659178|nr:caspase family protein [Streptomyces scabiei]
MGSAGTVQGEFQGRRRALLIGVSQTPALAEDQILDDWFAPLTSAEKDVSLVAEALEKSGYGVTEHHAGRVPEFKLGRSGLQRALRHFLASCEPGDTAFVYISCHGVTLGDNDFLLAADAQPGDARSDGTPTLMKSSLLGADPAGLQLDALQKGVTAVICLDACREAEPAQRDDSTGVWVPAQDVVWLYSCGAGQRSYADPVHGSWFGRALAQALAPDTPPTTFGEIMRYTEQEMRRLAGDEPVDPPTVKHLAPFPQAVDTLELCKGYKEPLPWAEMVTKSTLWEHTSGSPETHDRVKAGLAELAKSIGRDLQGAGAHNDDPWRDSTYPARFERRLVGLLERARQGEPRMLLSPAETAVLLAAPLVHENVTAVALEDLRQVLDRGCPAGTEPDDHGKLVLAAVEDVRRAHKQVQGTIETLRGRNLAVEARAAEHWLRHRFISDWDPLWERDGGYASVNALLGKLARVIANSAEPVPSGGPSERSLRRVEAQLRQVLGHLTVEPGDRPRINDSDDGWDTFDPAPECRWRAPQLAQLLWTAGLLAGDPRRMSSVLVNHLGAHEPLAPLSVVHTLSEEFDLAAVGGLTGSTYALDVRFHCPHPALHAAVEELAARADTAVSAIRSRWLEQRSSLPSLLRGLPERVTARQLVPEPGQYTAPLERFRLAEDEIRPLLMGAQLYGDKMLAVRELYQNALDACRLRDMRDQYGRKQGEATERWTGRITFTQDYDDDGRLYIECEDNGTGMSRAKLTSMFARAGKRYEQDPEFMQERREWRRAELTPMALNSRFGIGVFSYFMLAEEVVVTTAPVNRYGLRESLDQASRAEIQSGSGLLRITPGKGVPPDGGTRVRLYLALGKDEQPPSLVETLQSVLWVSDYTVRAVEYARDEPGREVRSRTWTPGKLQAVARWRGPAAHLAGSDVWLVQGTGQLLLDGVVVSDAPSVFGYVVNLRERHRPVPSVDRNNLLSYDEEVVLDELRATVRDAVAQWSEVSLRWLWQLAKQRPPLAVSVLDSLPKDATAVLEPRQSDTRLLRERLPLKSTGCLPIDEAIVSKGKQSPHSDSSAAQLFKRWRMTQLEHAPLPEEEFSPPGYPEATGLDAMVFHEASSPAGGWSGVLAAAAWARVPIRAAVKALRRYAITGAVVPAVADIRSQLSAEITPAAAKLHAAYLARPAHALRPPAEHAPILVISAEYQLSLGECVSMLRHLRTLDSRLPPAPELDDALARARFTRMEANVLAADNAGPGWLPTLRWRPGEVSITHLRQRVSLVGDGVSVVDELLACAHRMAPLGFTVLGDRDPRPGPQDALTTAERLLLRIDESGGTPWQDGTVSMRYLVTASAELTISLGDAVRILAESSSFTGVHPPHAPDEVAGWTPPSWVHRRMQYWSREKQAFGPWELIEAYLYARRVHDLRNNDEFRETTTALDACGLLMRDPSWDHEALLRQAAAPRLSPGNSGYTDTALDSRPMSAAACLELATPKETLGDVLDRLEAAERHLPIHLPEVSPEARSLRIGPYDLYALAHTDSTPNSASSPSARTVQRLFKHAEILGIPLSESIDRLSTLTLIGAPPIVGDFTGSDAESLSDFTPDRFDRAAFSPSLLGPGTLGPLELVLVAGRFGWTLRKTYDRYAPFRCLGLNVTVREPTSQEADIVPHWADVIVLTEQLTGRAPAVSGTVTPDHIRLCAEETDLTETKVGERLERYAALFGLRLPTQESETAS